jgi:hypothetical protein
MRWALCLVVWAVCLGAALLTAAKTKVGPIVIKFSPNHGVHLGDALAVALGVAVASLVTLAAWLTRSSRAAHPDRRPAGEAVVRDAGAPQVSAGAAGDHRTSSEPSRRSSERR